MGNDSFSPIRRTKAHPDLKNLFQMSKISDSKRPPTPPPEKKELTTTSLPTPPPSPLPDQQDLDIGAVIEKLRVWERYQREIEMATMVDQFELRPDPEPEHKLYKGGYNDDQGEIGRGRRNRGGGQKVMWGMCVVQKDEGEKKEERV